MKNKSSETFSYIQKHRWSTSFRWHVSINIHGWWWSSCVDDSDDQLWSFRCFHGFMRNKHPWDFPNMDTQMTTILFLELLFRNHHFLVPSLKVTVFPLKIGKMAPKGSRMVSLCHLFFRGKLAVSLQGGYPFVQFPVAELMAEVRCFVVALNVKWRANKFRVLLETWKHFFFWGGCYMFIDMLRNVYPCVFKYTYIYIYMCVCLNVHIWSSIFRMMSI